MLAGYLDLLLTAHYHVSASNEAEREVIYH